MKTILLLATVALMVSCGPSVRIDFDKDQDFTGFNTYTFYPDIDSGLNQLDDKRVMKAIDSVFGQRGFSKSDYNRFFVNFYAEESIGTSRNSIGIGVGGGGRSGGIGVSGGIPIGGPKINQKLTIDIVDANNNQELVWQAIIEGELKEKASPVQKEAYYLSIITKALKKFPPQK